ncbi:U-box domain-containing protein 28-like [Amaranthus tricolor]|uniref:U-box domain-containing protein 28-like n=1 Tax=Amaranthus tricolor TaxID=29722 RepID=UPI0025906146|nr:U-box domain-containing protein 28-like [Amaranthus tricolor]
MAKNQNELCVSIPSYFRCPISLEVMKSPVSLSTGITYDRSSIQAWLDCGNTTCPATMQYLSSPSFVPNLTLHRLIHLWSLSHTFSPPSPRLVHLPSLHSKPREVCSSLKNILDRARKSVDYCRVLATSDDFLDSFVKLMVKCDDIENLELIFLILNLFGGEKIQKLMNSDFFPKFIVVLRNGSIESKIAAAKIVQKIAIDKETKTLLIETPNLLLELYNLVTSVPDSSIEAGLSALIAIASSKSTKTELVKFGIVKKVSEILCDAGRSDSMVIDRSLEMLEIMSTCAEGRASICEEEKCVVEIVRKLMKVSDKATEHGVTVLWSVCYLFRDEKVKEILGRSNGLGKFLLLLQSNCKPIVKQMCGDLVKVLRVNYKSCLGVYDTKTTHIMPY